MIDIRNYLLNKMEEKRLPEHSRETLLEYILQGRKTGGFLEALLSNDFMRAFEKADLHNRRSFLNYAEFLLNDAPRGCWGSSHIYERWISKGGLIGQEE